MHEILGSKGKKEVFVATIFETFNDLERIFPGFGIRGRTRKRSVEFGVFHSPSATRGQTHTGQRRTPRGRIH